MKIGCVVVAAGRGKRAGFAYNKVFYKLFGRTVLSRTIDALCASEEIDEIVLVINANDLSLVEKTIKEEGINPRVKSTVYGGETRRQSVYAGLKALSDDTDIVLIHDGARPFVSNEIIHNVIEDAIRYRSGVISTVITDTVKHLDSYGQAVSTINRNFLRTVQTPQAFDYKMLVKAHDSKNPDEEATDDAFLFERMFGSVHLTSAKTAANNIKLTTQEDFNMAENIVAIPFRVGTGYDVHRLIEGRKLILCGVEIDYDKGLLGHSDADVAIHALIDAMLGAAALGDIGRHFPDSDPKYKGISSLFLLHETDHIVKASGFELVNCDITIVCQAPKLSAHIETMRKNIADTLSIDISCVSVKATTTEKLGFEGEGLGISAQSTVMIRRVSLCTGSQVFQ